MKLSVIVSTYNSPKWLEKVLWGFLTQTEQDFELVIADDGSNEDTRNLIASFQGKFKFPIVHVWHEDKGFRKTVIVNKAIVESSCDYLLFCDGDCINRNDYIEVHLANRKPNYFLSGGCVRLPMSTSESIQQNHVMNQECFDVCWLRNNGLPRSSKNLKLRAKSLGIDKLLNKITTTKATWNGHGSSGWKNDILKVNGFDERMEWGAEDREMGERLWNIGIKSKQMRFSAVSVHLDHSRGYVRQEAVDKNMKIWNETKKAKKTFTEFGIQKKIYTIA